MEVEQWYAIALGVLLAFFLLRQVWFILNRWAFPRLVSFFLRSVRYRLLLRGREWLPWTWFEAICLLFYLIASVFTELLFVENLRDLERRAAVLVTMSLFPLYVSGKTHLALDWLGMPLPFYMFLQRSMCGVAFLYSTIHFIGVLQLRVRAGQIATSGYIAAGSLLAILMLWLIGFLLSLCFRRLPFSPVFQAMHTTLTLCSLASLSWHVISLPSPTITSRGAVLAAVIIWFLTALIRLLRVIFQGRARIKGRRDYKRVVRVHVQFGRSIKISPGSYFYFLFPSLRNIVYSYPLTAIPTDSTPAASQGIQDFIFILDADEHSRILNRLHVGRSLFLDGPYGSEIDGEAYENLILTARGIGIVGVLPIALEIAKHKRHNTVIKERVKELQDKQSQLLREMPETPTTNIVRIQEDLARINSEEAAIQVNLVRHSITRRVDILWELDENTQTEWVQSQIKMLQDSDPRGTLFVFWCIFPSPEAKNAPTPFKTTDHFRRLYPSVNLPSFVEIFETKLSEALQSPGKTLVLACGSPPFVEKVRYGVIDSMASGTVVHFRESEFRPRRSKNSGRPSRDLTTVELESYLS